MEERSAVSLVAGLRAAAAGSSGSVPVRISSGAVSIPQAEFTSVLCSLAGFVSGLMPIPVSLFSLPMFGEGLTGAAYFSGCSGETAVVVFAAAGKEKEEEDSCREASVPVAESPGVAKEDGLVG
jgi:hypothetical protein